LPYCNDLEVQLISELKRRRGAPIFAKDLGTLLHLDQRDVRDVIAHLIDDHDMAICSTSKDGYWWAQSPEEIDRTLAQLISRQRWIYRRIRGLERAREKEFGERPQMVMEWEVAG